MLARQRWLMPCSDAVAYLPPVDKPGLVDKLVHQVVMLGQNNADIGYQQLFSYPHARVENNQPANKNQSCRNMRVIAN